MLLGVAPRSLTRRSGRDLGGQAAERRTWPAPRWPRPAGTPTAGASPVFCAGSPVRTSTAPSCWRDLLAREHALRDHLRHLRVDLHRALTTCNAHLAAVNSLYLRLGLGP